MSYDNTRIKIPSAADMKQWIMNMVDTKSNIAGVGRSPLETLYEYVNTEFDKVSRESKRPETFGIGFEILHAVPQKYKEGDLYYGAAGVFSGQAGLYIRDGNSWRKL